jgi:ubiquitin-protein ligase E3 C
VVNYNGDVQDLCLSFSIPEVFLGQTKNIELLPGGDAIPVTSENSTIVSSSVANDYYFRNAIRITCR